MTVLNIEGRRVTVSPDFLNLSPEEQARTVEQIASQMNLTPQRGEGFMAQMNRGIADTLGGISPDVGLGRTVRRGVNALLGTDMPIESPLDGNMATQFRNMGVPVAEGSPQGILEGAARGTGYAAGILPFAVGGAGLVQGTSRVGGVTANVADDIARSLSTRVGMATEMGAGAASGAASTGVKDAGGSQFMQDMAGLAAPLSLAGLAPAARLADRGVKAMPGLGYVRRMAGDVAGALIPMTATGARAVARNRLDQLTGGRLRSTELSERINPNDPLGRSPAEQTGDPNLLGLQRAVERENPLARVEGEQRTAETQRRAGAEIASMGGNVQDARRFFDRQLRAYRTNMRDRVDTEMRMATERVEGTGPRTSESAASTRMVERVKSALNEQLQEEAALWRAVPNEAMVGTNTSRGAAETLMAELPRAQQSDFPNVARLLMDEDGLGPETTVSEMHGLYSELRRVSRSAMAGTDQNKNRARIANDLADAILQDLGAIGGETPAGQAINNARAFSRALHETFDQGAVGRILQRTIDGDERMTAESALRRTVGRGGSDALADDQSIRTAARDAGEDVSEYLRGRFVDSVLDPQGNFSRATALRWMRENRELLTRYPGLNTEFRQALRSQDAADLFSARAKLAATAAERSPMARFNEGQPSDAIQSVLTADNPASVARRLAAQARQDRSGQAFTGLKGAFTDYLIGQSSGADGLSARELSALVNDPRMGGALRQVFSAPEMTRLQRVARELATAQGPANEVGDVLNTPVTKVIEMVARYLAVQATAGQGNSAGASLQIANMASGRAKDFVSRLTNDRARQLVVDAVRDPDLMRALLSEFPDSPQVRTRLAPYLVGAAAQEAEE